LFNPFHFAILGVVKPKSKFLVQILNLNTSKEGLRI
jgi:hypothetical protein